MASVLLILENLGEDKHVESVWLPRLDEGSTPSSSTINTDNQMFINFAPSSAPLLRRRYFIYDSLLLLIFILLNILTV